MIENNEDKVYVELLHASLIKGRRYERGTKMHISQDLFSSLGKDTVMLVNESKSVSEDVELDTSNIGDMTVSQLRQLAHQMGLEMTGTKKDLINRIQLVGEVVETESEETE